MAAAAVVLGIAAAVAVVIARGPERREAGLPAAGTPDAPAAAGATPAAPAAEPASTERRRPAASGGVAILASGVRAEAVVTGVVSDVASIDVHGWRADLHVDRVLLGNVRLGDTATIAWEELSTARRVRFEDGQRVLVVLDTLPTQSLWRKRFSAPDRARGVLVVASGGDAFLPRPDGLTLDALEHYLAMTASARDGAPGALRLAELVAGGHPAVAREALALLEAQPARVDLLGADGAESLLGAARNPEREPSLRKTALGLAVRHRLPGARETALALSEPASPIRAAAYRALAALPEGLSAERVERLLLDADPDLRIVGVEGLRADTRRERFAGFIRDDPSPAVRLTAGRLLLARHGSGGIADVIGLLDDPDGSVRSGIAESIGALGVVAVAPLSTVVDGGSERAALAAVLGLSRTGRQGGAKLESIAEVHPNHTVRAFARLALGEAPGHSH